LFIVKYCMCYSVLSFIQYIYYYLIKSVLFLNYPIAKKKIRTVVRSGAEKKNYCNNRHQKFPDGIVVCTDHNNYNRYDIKQIYFIAIYVFYYTCIRIAVLSTPERAKTGDSSTPSFKGCQGNKVYR
jgi:hypothetical protein